MSNIRGLRHIKTHGSLDRQGLLIGVAKNMHGRGGVVGRPNVDSQEQDWKVEPLSINLPGKTGIRARSATASLYRDLEDKVLTYLTDNTLDLLEEIQRAKNEGFSVCFSELERLQEKLARLKKAGQ